MTAPASIDARLVTDSLKLQYRKSFRMLRDIVDRFPDEFWTSSNFGPNAAWQLAYHVLYFTHLYLMPGESDFEPWPGQHAPAQHPDGIAGGNDPASALPLLPEPYDRKEVLAYIGYLEARLDEMVERLDMTTADCGFYWYEQGKLEHQLNNLRHLQHHTAQLADRLRSCTGMGTAWK